MWYIELDAEWRERYTSWSLGINGYPCFIPHLYSDHAVNSMHIIPLSTVLDTSKHSVNAKDRMRYDKTVTGSTMPMKAPAPRRPKTPNHMPSFPFQIYSLIRVLYAMLLQPQLYPHVIQETENEKKKGLVPTTRPTPPSRPPG